MYQIDPAPSAAERKFGRYWRVIRPMGAFVTRQFLKAVARLVERDPILDRLEDR
jgi:hypothetical protein